MPNVRGKYDKRDVEANLFLMICAPAASGKGSLTWSFKAIDNIIKSMDEKFKSEMELYENSVGVDDAKEGSRAKKPIHHSITVPGNTSVPAMTQCLKENQNRGLIFETEADTIANTMKNDWGNYSDLLRKTFHHERISSRRKTDNEKTEISNPCLSVLLSGTPDQIKSLLSSTENGLFSRFLFYNFRSKPQWKDVFDDEKNDSVFLDYMDYRLPGATEFVYQVCNQKEKIIFTFNYLQKKKFNEIFAAWLLEADFLLGGDTNATIRRLGLIHFRIAMILSVFRQHQHLVEVSEIICDDRDFDIATEIVSCLKSHALKIISELRSANRATKFSNGLQMTYFKMLPKDFSRAAAENAATKMNLNLKTAERYLEVYTKKGMIERTKHGQYSKTN